MRTDIPKPDSETTKSPLIAIFVIVILFILGYFAYMMFIPEQNEHLNRTENIKPVEQKAKDSI